MAKYSVNLCAPRIINGAYALLGWRTTSRPKYEMTFAFNDPASWEDPRRVCRWMTRDLAELIYEGKEIVVDNTCVGARVKGLAEGERNMLEDLYLYSYFDKATKDHMSQLDEISDYIKSSPLLYTTWNDMYRISRNLLDHIAYHAKEPFFHTPKSVAHIIGRLVSHIYSQGATDKNTDKRHETIVYDPCAGYGELFGELPKFIDAKGYYHQDGDTLGAKGDNLTWWILRYCGGEHKYEYMNLRAANKKIKPHYIVSNPPHAWNPDMMGFNGTYIREHIEMLQAGGVYITTCSKKHFDGTPEDEQDKEYVLKGRYLRWVIELPTHLMIGTDENPIILVFIKRVIRSNDIIYIDGKMQGYDPSPGHSKCSIIRHSEIEKITEMHGILGTHAHRSTRLKRFGNWGVGYLQDGDRLAIPGMKGDMVFRQHGDL